MTQGNEGRAFPKELIDVLMLARDYVQKDFDGFGDPRESDILKRIDAIIVRQSPDTIPAVVTWAMVEALPRHNIQEQGKTGWSDGRLLSDIRELFENEKT